MQIAVLELELAMSRAPPPSSRGTETPRSGPRLGLEFYNPFGTPKGESMILKCEGPALKAGIQIRDRVKDETRRRIGELLKTLKPGDPIDLPILRKNQELVFRVVLGEPQASDRYELR